MRAPQPKPVTALFAPKLPLIDDHLARNGRRLKLSYVIAEPPNSFSSLEKFASALRLVKELGYDGVEVYLSRSANFELNQFLRVLESIRVPIVSFMTGLNYFSEGLC